MTLTSAKEYILSKISGPSTDGRSPLRSSMVLSHADNYVIMEVLSMYDQGKINEADIPGLCAQYRFDTFDQMIEAARQIATEHPELLNNSRG